MKRALCAALADAKEKARKKTPRTSREDSSSRAEARGVRGVGVGGSGSVPDGLEDGGNR